MVDVTCTPSSVTVLVEVRVQPIEHLRNSSMLPDVNGQEEVSVCGQQKYPPLARKRIIP